MELKLTALPLLLLLLHPAVGEPAHPGYAHAEQACGVAEAETAAPAPVRREEFDGGRIVDISHYYREDMPAWESSEGDGEFLRLARSMRNGSDIANFSELRLTAHSGTHVDAPGHVFQHYYDAGFDVDTLDLAVLNGPALMVDVPKDKNITASVMESLHIPKGVRRVLFRTLNTDRKLMWKKEFDSSYVGFMKDGARWLVDNTDIKLIGKLLPLGGPLVALSLCKKAQGMGARPINLTRFKSNAESIPLLDTDQMAYREPRGVGDGSTSISLARVDYLSVGAFDECIPAHLVFLEQREVILVEALNLEHVTPGIYNLHCLPLRLRGAEGSPARCILIK